MLRHQQSLRTRLSTLASLGTCFVLTAAAAAEPTGNATAAPITVLESMVVSGTDTESKLIHKPLVINVLTAEDLARSGKSTLTDVLESIPGLYVERSAGTPHLNLRGQRTGMSSGATVYIDGQRVDFGISNFHILDAVSIDAIERIEVIKAPPPSVYGADGGRGVIHIYTKRAGAVAVPMSGQLRLAVGSWQTIKSALSISGRSGDWDYAFNASGDSSTGYRHNDKESCFVKGELGYNFSTDTRLSVFAGYNFLDRLYPQSFSTPAQSKTMAREPGTATSHPNPIKSWVAFAGSNYRSVWGDWNVRAQLNFSIQDEQYNSISNTASMSYIDQRDENQYQGMFSLSRCIYDSRQLSNTLSIGTDFDLATFSQLRRRKLSQVIMANESMDLDRQRYGVFLTNETSWNRFALLAGGRFDHFQFDLANLNPAQADVNNTFRNWSWNIAPSYALTDNSNLYLSLSKAVWYPPARYISHAMIHAGIGASLDKILPEESASVELGFKHQLSNAFNYSIALFNTDTKNKYVSSRNAGGAFIGYQAIGDARHRGIELEADGQALPWLDYRVAFTYLDAEWRKATASTYPNGIGAINHNTDISGKKVNNTPQYEYLTSLTMHLSQKLRLGVSTRYTASEYIDFNNRFKNQNRFLVDSKLTYDLSSTLTVYALVNNLFDKHYNNVFNSSGRLNADGSFRDASYYPQDRRYFEVGASLSF